jgi:hypothetical protein
MKKLKLKLDLDDLSVETFVSGVSLPVGGTVRGHDQDALEADTGDTYDLYCGDGDYAATHLSQSTCPCNWSCLKNCSTVGG